MQSPPQPRSTARERDRGFTLVELLVVVIIVGVLAAVAVPVFLSQRDKAARRATDANMRNLVTEIYGARENAGQRLHQITGTACSACVCRDHPPMRKVTDPAFPGTSCSNVWNTAANRLAATSGSTVPAMKAMMTDGWGYPIVPDENEGETGVCGTRMDEVWSAGQNHVLGLYPKDADDLFMEVPAGGCSF